MPKRFLQALIHPVKEFSQSGKLGGLLLVLATVVSISVTNSSLQERYLHFWHQDIGFTFLSMQLDHWVNDLLMAVFFFLVGLEIKRELISGELSSAKNAMLPFFAALGGMLLPALIFTAFNHGTEHAGGWAIPTATDIAFSLGILSLLGKRVPLSLKIFLTALAIIDDLGGILIIAIVYTSKIHFEFLIWSLALLSVLFLLNKNKVKNLLLYFIPAVFLWYFIYRSGVHATIAGVLAALFIPAGSLEKLEHSLNKPVNYLVLPLFALANTTILLSMQSVPDLASALGIGIILALFIGKTLGITSFVFLSIKTGVCALPQNLSMKDIFGVSMLAGIGFTISLFFTSLSFTDADSANIARLSIIAGSFLSAISGMIYLSLTLDKKKNP